MSPDNSSKTAIRRELRQKLAELSSSEVHRKSLAACALVAATPEFQSASVVMLYLATPLEVDASQLALKAWTAGKTVVVPKVSWDQKRMLPIEINSLTSGLTTGQFGIREPAAGSPIPLNLIDFAIVPGLGFTQDGHRIGRGMGFYDRFLGQKEFLGVSCGLAFEEQIVPHLPMLDHDIPVAMLATDQSIRRLASNCIGQK